MLLQEMEMFYYVVQLGSFSQTAEKLDVSKAQVSRGISKLESALKTQLLFRSTRKLALTEAGEKFYTHCDALINEAEEGIAALSQTNEKPFGTLKVTAPPALGNYILADFLPKFIKKYPDLHLNVILEGQIANIISEGFDIALRAAPLNDSQFIAQKLSGFTSVLCASPDFLETHGVPQSCDDLQNLPFLAYINLGKPQLKIKLRCKEVIEEVTIKSTFNSNQAELLKRMALASIGIVNLPYFMIKKELKENKLIHCLPKYNIIHSDLYIIYHSKKFLPQKTLTFIDELKKYFNRTRPSEV